MQKYSAEIGFARFQVLHVGGQMDILQRRLSDLGFKGPRSERKSIVRAANKIIEKHQKIIYFSQNIEILYTHIALLLFASNTVLICSLGFTIVTVSALECRTERPLTFYPIESIAHHESLSYACLILLDNWHTRRHEADREVAFLLYSDESRGAHLLLRRGISEQQGQCATGD